LAWDTALDESHRYEEDNGAVDPEPARPPRRHDHDVGRDQPILQGGKTENNTRNRQHSTVARHGAAALLYQSSHEGDIGLQCFRLIAHPRPPLLD
jgi:hypothetical protein